MQCGHNSFSLKNDLAELETLRLELEQFASKHQLPHKTLFELNLALDELVTNIISYGYEDTSRHDIIIELHLEGDTVCIRLEDDGIAFNPLDAAPPDLDVPVEERQIGGLGIHLVRKLMDDVSYENKNKRNIVRLRKLLAARTDMEGDE